MAGLKDATTYSMWGRDILVTHRRLDWLILKVQELYLMHILDQWQKIGKLREYC